MSTPTDEDESCTTWKDCIDHNIAREDDIFTNSMCKELAGNHVSADSCLSCAWHGVAERQQHAQVTADNGIVPVNAAKWVTGVLKPTTAHVDYEQVEEGTVDEGMPEQGLEPQVPEGADRSKLPTSTSPVLPPPPFGDEHNKGCERRREALGMLRRHV